MAGVRSLSSLAGESESTGVELICHLETEAVYTLDRPERSYSGTDQAPAGWVNFVEPVRGRSPAISAYRIKECLVTPNARVMTANGSFVQESLFPYVRWGDIQAAFHPFILWEADGEGLSLRLSGLTRIREPVFFAREHGEAGYFHWLHSIIPRTTLYAALDGAPRRLLVALTAPYQLQSLAALGWPRDRTR